MNVSNSDDSHNRTPTLRSGSGRRMVSFDNNATVVIRCGKEEDLHAASLTPWIGTETEKLDVASAPTTSRAIKRGVTENRLYHPFHKVVVTPTSSNEDMVVEDSNTEMSHLHPSQPYHKKDKTHVSPRRISPRSRPSIWSAKAPPLAPILKHNQSRWDATYSSTYKNSDDSVPANNSLRQHHSSPLIMPKRSTSFHGSSTLRPPAPLLHLEEEEEEMEATESSRMVVEEDHY